MNGQLIAKSIEEIDLEIIDEHIKKRTEVKKQSIIKKRTFVAKIIIVTISIFCFISAFLGIATAKTPIEHMRIAYIDTRYMYIILSGVVCVVIGVLSFIIVKKQIIKKVNSIVIY